MNGSWLRVWGQRALLCSGVAAGALSCLPQNDPVGLRATPKGSGPRVRFLLDASGGPEAPYPNDVFTRADRTSATGRRLNLSRIASTTLESDLRSALLESDGFSPFAPIEVPFDAPLDLAALDGRGRDPKDDPVLVLALGSGQRFGERVDLDLGRGLFPLSVADPRGYFPDDARGGADNLVFETVDEDRDGDGQFGADEDTDADGVFDRPNLRAGGTDPARDLLDYYERETNTLLLRPLEPLQQGTTYAVVLTEALHGADGAPVRSPFDWVHHIEQTDALARLPEALALHGRDLSQVAFVWTFTTQTVTQTLDTLRAGLNGEGVFEALATDYGVEVRVDRLRSAGEAAGILPGAALRAALPALAPVVAPGANVQAWQRDLESVAYLVGGAFVSPDLMVDDDGERAGGVLRAADEDERFRLDLQTGDLTVGRTEVPFWCAVPIPSAGRQPPYPVAIYLPDHQRSRADVLAWAGSMARAGLVSCGLDLFGQGVRLTAAQQAALDAVVFAEGQPEGTPGRPAPLRASWEAARARDLDNDGQPDPDADTFAIDLVHARDIQRQRAVEVAQFVRVLRAFDGVRRWETRFAAGTLAGDFDGDDRVDFGGPGVGIHLTGLGTGANTATLVAGIEPEVSRLAAVSPGGGLTDVVARSAMPGLRERFWAGAFGPLVLGAPGPSGETILSFLAPAGNGLAGGSEALPFGRESRLVAGDRVVLTNLRSSERREGRVDAEGTVRVGVPADAALPTALRLAAQLAMQEGDLLPYTRLGDPLRFEVFERGGRRRRIEAFDQALTYLGITWPVGQALTALSRGLGFRRQTPGLRHWLSNAQVLLDPADPINYAHRLVQRPPPGALNRGALFVLTAGDGAVPVASGLALTRAAGLVDRAADAELVAVDAVRSLARVSPLVDVDNLSSGQTAADPPKLATPQRREVNLAGGPLVVRHAWLGAEGAHGFGPPGSGSDAEWDGPGALGALVAGFLVDGTVSEGPDDTEGVGVVDPGGIPEPELP